MTEDQYSVLSPYIHIPPEDTVRHTPQLYITETVPVENIKYKTGTILDLNRADTTELKKGSGYRKRHCPPDCGLSATPWRILPNRTIKGYQSGYPTTASLV